jgi:hypothetical protein
MLYKGGECPVSGSPPYPGLGSKESPPSPTLNKWPCRSAEQAVPDWTTDRLTPCTAPRSLRTFRSPDVPISERRIIGEYGIGVRPQHPFVTERRWEDDVEHPVDAQKIGDADKTVFAAEK